MAQKRYCPHCWNLVPLDTMTCPECGKTLPPEIPEEEFKMEETIVDKYFCFRGRMGRRDFFVRNMIYFALIGLLYYFFFPGGWELFAEGGVGFFLTWLIKPLATGVDPMLLPSRGAIAIIWMITLFLLLGQWSLNIRRCHDVGRRGSFSLLMFVPVINVVVALYLYLKKGTEGANQYGEQQHKC